MIDTDDDVMDLIDAEAAKLAEKVVDAFESKSVIAELFLSFIQFAVDLAQDHGMTERDFMLTVRETWMIAAATQAAINRLKDPTFVTSNKEWN